MKKFLLLLCCLFFTVFNINAATNYILKTGKAHSYKEFLKYYKKVPYKKTFAKGKLIKNNINIFDSFSNKVIERNNSFALLGDPLLSKQTWLKQLDGEELINLSKGRNIIVGVLDSGVEKDHEDLEGQIIKYHNVAENNDDISDSYGHGTAVAGIIAAIANNGNGIRGIAPESKLVVAKINSGGSPTFDDYSVAAGIYYLVDNGAKVINMSIQMNSSNEAIEDAIDYAKEKGVILVAASGNFGDDQQAYPASNDYVLGVGSINENFEISSFSNYDENIFVFAPGENVLSTYINNNYSYETGTSFSAPMVTGLIADLFSLNPYLSFDDLKQIIINSTDLKTVSNNFKIPDLDNSVYGSGVKIITNKDDYNNGDVLELSVKLPPLTHLFNLYFGIVFPDNEIALLKSYNEEVFWTLTDENNLTPSMTNISNNNYSEYSIFGDNESLFPALQLTGNLLYGTYSICGLYEINGNIIGYFNCKNITINK